MPDRTNSMTDTFRYCYGAPGDGGERERGYIEGHRRAWIQQASHVLHTLDADSATIRSSQGNAGLSLEERVLRLEIERQEAIQALREVCDEHGDNDWSDDLHLRDIIEKHLAPHLDADD